MFISDPLNYCNKHVISNKNKKYNFSPNEYIIDHITYFCFRSFKFHTLPLPSSNNHLGWFSLTLKNSTFTAVVFLYQYSFSISGNSLESFKLDIINPQGIVF